MLPERGVLFQLSEIKLESITSEVFIVEIATVEHVLGSEAKYKSKKARAYSRNLGQHSILARKGNFYEKGHFFKKRTPKIPPTPYSISFLSVLHQNKALHNFHKRGQHLIVERNTGLEYALKAKPPQP